MPTLVEQGQQGIRESVAYKEGFDDGYNAGVQAERCRIREAVSALRQSVPDNSQGFLSAGIMMASQCAVDDHNQIISDVLVVIEGEI